MVWKKICQEDLRNLLNPLEKLYIKNNNTTISLTNFQLFGFYQDFKKSQLQTNLHFSFKLDKFGQEFVQT